MKKKHVSMRNLCYSFLISFILIGTSLQGAGFGGGVEPSPNVFARIMGDSEGPSTTIEVQALKDGISLDILAEETLGSTGKSGLGGESGSDPSILPTVDEKASISTRDVQALREGYAVMVSVNEEVGDTGKPGLGGENAIDPSILPTADAEGPI